jgi:hypothetical protein
MRTLMAALMDHGNLPLPSKLRMTSKSVLKLTQAHDMLTKTVHPTLYKDPQLSKMSARWVTKMLYEKMKKDRLKMCKAVKSIISVAS